MKKALQKIALVLTGLIFIALLVSIVSIVVFLIQGDLPDALNSFYNCIYAVLALVIISVLADEFN